MEKQERPLREEDSMFEYPLKIEATPVERDDTWRTQRPKVLRLLLTLRRFAEHAVSLGVEEWEIHGHGDTRSGAER